MKATPTQLSEDAERVRNEYARRERELPADRYAWSNAGNLLAHAQISRAVIAKLVQLGHFPLTGRKVLEVGCGAGTWLLESVQWGAIPNDLAGIDLLPARIDAARVRLSKADLRVGNAGDLPWADDSFDVVTQYLMLSSVLDRQVQARIAGEMMRVLRPGGVIISVDFTWNNPWNRNVRGVTLPRIHELFRGWRVQTSSLLLPPPVTRIVGRLSWPAALMLESLPFLRTHRVVAISRGQQ